MPRPAQRCCLLLALLAAMPGACRSHPATHAPTPGSAAAAPGAPVDNDAPVAKRPQSVRSAPSIRVAGMPGHAGEVMISVQNRAPDPVQVAAALSVERRADQGFHPVEGAQIALQPNTACVQLVPGAELRPAAWRNAQPTVAGTYRFVLQGCDGSYRVESDPFELK